MKAEVKNILAQLRKLTLAQREEMMAQLDIELETSDEQFIDDIKTQSGIVCPFLAVMNA